MRLILLNNSFPSLSGTFGIPTGLTLNPKMPKEPSSPSHANARPEKHCVKNETNRLRNNNGQRTTRAHSLFGRGMVSRDTTSPGFSTSVDRKIGTWDSQTSHSPGPLAGIKK